MITEDYVSYEVAKLLKEKGFDYQGFDYIDFEGEVIKQDRPTHQMAMKWLREVHNIHCDIHLSFSEDPKNYPSGYYIYILNTKDGNTVENPGNNISEIHPLYKDKSCTPRNYHTYEDAVEAALKYALENLI